MLRYFLAALLICGSAQAQSTSGSVTATIVGSPSAVVSTSQTTGGTAQVLFATKPKNGFKVALPSATTSSLPCWVSDVVTNPSATQAGSFPVFLQGQYSTEPGEKPYSAVYINCPVTGQLISAKQW